MIIEIRQHRDDPDMYELLQVVNDVPTFFMAVVHTDVLEKDVNPGAYDETRMRVEMKPVITDEQV